MSKISEKCPAVYIQDALRRTVEKSTKGRVTVLYDETGIPSFMLRIDRFRLEAVDSALGKGWHPAFMNNGKEVGAIYVGLSNAAVIDGRAYSLPEEPAARNIDFDEARAACAKKGKGWHLLTSWEYAAMTAHLAKRPCKEFSKEWWDWTDGLKLVNGALRFPNDNAYEMAEADWPAQGIAFDDDAGTPILSDSVSHYTEKLDPDGDNNQYGDYAYIDDIRDLQKSDTYTAIPEEARLRLAQMLIDPLASPIMEEIYASLYVRNYGERLPRRGGGWSNGANDGLGCLNLNHRRSYSNSYFGFRPAFIGELNT
jgi:hypothetical protein